AIGATASAIAIQAEQYKLTKREMAELIAQQTGQTVEQIERDSDRDRWFTAAQAKEYGFVDEVIERVQEIQGPSGTARAEPRNRSEFRRGHAPVRPLRAVRAAFLRGAHELRGQGVQSVQQAL